MAVLKFTVVGRPRAKGSLSKGRFGGLYFPKVVREWEQLVTKEAALAMKREGMPRFETSVRVGIRFCLRATAGGMYPGTMVGDLDKLERAVLDALTKAGAYRDDVQVVGMLSSKLPLRNGQVEHAEVSIVTADTTETLGS